MLFERVGSYNKAYLSEAYISPQSESADVGLHLQSLQNEDIFFNICLITLVCI